MRALTWLMRAAVFFVLFAFALNNQDDATIKWFFGRQWRAPMVFIVLAAFALGCALGIAAMLPSWWRHRRLAQQQRTPRTEVAAPALEPEAVARGTEPAPLEHPPRDGV
jgi:putative membrane protein